MWTAVRQEVSLVHWIWHFRLEDYYKSVLTLRWQIVVRQVIQIAKHLGIKTINVVRRPEQKEELLALGADEVICSTTEGDFLYHRSFQDTCPHLGGKENLFSGS
jgi:hypothetical protein